MLAPVFGAGVVIGHQGGWDEALILLAPVLVLTGLVAAAWARAARRADGDAPPHGDRPLPR